MKEPTRVLFVSFRLSFDSLEPFKLNNFTSPEGTSYDSKLINE